MERNCLRVQYLNECRRQQMLARVLLHVIAASVGVNGSANLGPGGKHLAHAMPDLALLIFKNILHGSFERNPRSGLRGDSSQIKRLPAAARIKRGLVELHRPGGLIAVALQLARVHDIGAKVVEEGVVVIETMGHENRLSASGFEHSYRSIWSYAIVAARTTADRRRP